MVTWHENEEPKPHSADRKVPSTFFILPGGVERRHQDGELARKLRERQGLPERRANPDPTEIGSVPEEQTGEQPDQQ